MTTSYPILSQDYLEPAPSRGMLGMRRKTRAGQRLPRPHAHQVLVYRVDGSYVVDDGRLPPDDTQVVRATHVSLVDRGSEVPVVVQFTVSSAEASDFTVRATFVCSVTDPVRVVRENVNAHTAILTYLKRYHRLSRMGVGHRMSQVNQVRRAVEGHLRAYTEKRPAMIPGLHATFTAVEVLTPDEVAAFEKALREKHRKHLLDTADQDYTHALATGQDRNVRDRADEDREHQQRVEVETEEHADLVELTRLRRRLRIQEIESEAARLRAAQAVDMIGGDPVKAQIYAHTVGDLGAKELAESMLAREERRDDARRADEAQRLQWRREDQLRREREQREDQQRRMAINVEVIQEMAKHGHANLLNIRLERIIAEVTGTPLDELSGPPPTAVGRSAHTEIEASERAVPDDGGEARTGGQVDDDDTDPDDDMGLREEDD
ncbi:adaptor complexes medium subunit family protein [Micromonospora sp. AKA38]|uniref:hypothetical protein n=1 Tax=Micromonospora sp. AKA38 TaxID=2733861 RepID=UPI0022BB2FFE|nr:hypothetical protein [Micromonospora sp. AKA38]GHJ12583.1 hypothetical protein TPA0908_05780 [Micromonospora sp. AKA38]